MQQTSLLVICTFILLVICTCYASDKHAARITSKSSLVARDPVDDEADVDADVGDESIYDDIDISGGDYDSSWDDEDGTDSRDDEGDTSTSTITISTTTTTTGDPTKQPFTCTLGNFPCGEICCPNGQICYGTYCGANCNVGLANKPCGATCCPNNLNCVEGFCVGGCTGNATACNGGCCPSDYKCINGQCVACPPCGSGECCSPGTCIFGRVCEDYRPPTITGILRPTAGLVQAKSAPVYASPKQSSGGGSTGATSAAVVLGLAVFYIIM